MNTFINISLLFTLIISSEAVKVLGVFPVPSISHQVVFRPLTQELAKRGHDVTVITTDPAFPKGEAPTNLTEIDVHDISYNIWREGFLKLASSRTTNDFLSQMVSVLPVLTEIFEAQLQVKEVQDIFSGANDKYDLIILEACMRPALILSHLFKAPLILVSSLGPYPNTNEMMGAPEHPILYPNVARTKLCNLTKWEQMTDVYTALKIKNAWKEHDKNDDFMLKKYFGPNIPTIQELSNNVDLLLLNSNPIFSGIIPVPPNVVFMGGLHQKPSKPLPTDLKEYLDSSKNGVVYVSFGTNVDATLLPADRIQMLVRVFSELPYDVLFKWNNDELPGRSKNIRISKWLPQSDLLRHPKVKAFITQGGLQSTDEAITAGVPLIGIPMLADQWFNVEKYIYHGIGVRLDIETLTADQLSKAIHTVVGDESYRRNVVRLRELMSDEPMKPLERAVWWMEYVIRHGGAKHLRSPAANITWAQYLELELVFTVLAVLSMAVILLILSVYYLNRYVLGKIYEAKLKTK